MRGLDIPVIRHALGVSQEPSLGDIEQRAAELLKQAAGLFESMLAHSDLITVSYVPEEQGYPADEGVVNRERVIQTQYGVPLIEAKKTLGTLHMDRNMSETLDNGIWVADKEYGDGYSVVLKRTDEDGTELTDLFDLLPMSGVTEFTFNLTNRKHEQVRYSDLQLIEQASTIMDRMATDIPA